MKKTVDSGQLTADSVKNIPVGQLVLSPEETRKNIDQAALAELAKSIAAQGVIEALLVRPTGTSLFEIVAGQRRWLASKLAGLDTVPCVVRAMSDEEAAETRIVSNDQREDLPPMEQAEAYGRLLDMPGATIETVAAKLAKSPSYVGRRLKLLEAIEPVREALKCGAIETGHALELARLSRRQQEELLEGLDVGYSAPEADGEADEDEDEGGATQAAAPGTCRFCYADEDDLRDNELTWADADRTVCSDPDCVREAISAGLLKLMVPTRTTVAELRSCIARTELRVLRAAPFPLADEIPPMACTACPKRTSGAASLFADIAEDTCTDPECYGAKLKVWVKAELERADLVMLYDGDAQDKAGVSKWNVAVGAECASREAAIWVSGRMMGRRVAICRDKHCATHGQGATAPAGTGGSRSGAAAKQLSAADKAKAEAQRAERQKLLEKVEAEKAYRERLWKELCAANVLPGKAEQNIVRKALAQTASQGGGLVARLLGLADDVFDYGKCGEALKRVEAMPYKDVLRAAALAPLVGELAVSEWSISKGDKPAKMEELAELLGIDAKKIRAGEKQPAADSGQRPAKAALKKAVEPKKTLLSPAVKKQIAAAQKKRWAALKTPPGEAAKKGGKK